MLAAGLLLLLPLLFPGGAAAQIIIPQSLLSQLIANYADDGPGGFVTLRLGSVRELAGSPEQVEQELMRPVPTATWRNFEGAAPFTATPTDTPTPTNTPTPTSTPTPTPTPTFTPTFTRTPTATEEPEEDEPPPPPPPTKTPTITPTPTPPDTEHPTIDDHGDPSPGPTGFPAGECAPVVIVTGIHITDAAPSYGMDWVKLKYQVVGFSGLIFSNDLSPPDSGGATKDGGWDAVYSGSIEFQIDTEWDSADSYHIDLHVRVRDMAGHERTEKIGSYTMHEACDEEPPD